MITRDQIVKLIREYEQGELDAVALANANRGAKMALMDLLAEWDAEAIPAIPLESLAPGLTVVQDQNS
jgi:hypothetical protein